ncbi:hypothetical protein CRG98_017246 [Punica granatum]|uniref:Uncharacterized protein n=1 Tax=Punica granatum TaxID=22663 RepID=A0A2I0K2T2_PUNGR|nr:hypothetical protein CRG98_017246 [Punica granatum]
MLSPNTDGTEAASPSITVEEADQLDCSTKRAKKVVDPDGTRSNVRAGEPSQGRSGVADDPKVGYVAALLGSQIGAGSGIFLGGPKSEENAKSMVDFTNPLRPRILHTDEELSCLRSRFGGFIIIKVLDAKEWVMLGGPWIIQGHYLTVRERTHDFNPRVSRIAKAAVWVRISDLPMDYHTNLSLRRIGYALGRTMRIDKHTQGLIRGNYARLCVEVIGEGGDQEVEMTSPMTEQNESAKGRSKEGEMAIGLAEDGQGVVASADDTKFGPWMHVRGKNHKSRQQAGRSGPIGENESHSQVGGFGYGSRFAALVKENIPLDSLDFSATAALIILPGETMKISNNGPNGVVAQKEKGKGVRAAEGRPKVLPRKSVDHGLAHASPVQKPDASAFTHPSILRRNGHGRTNSFAAAQHQDSPRAQRAGLANAANLQVGKAAANSTCGESSRLVPDPDLDPDPDDPTLACEGLNDMEDDLPKVDFQPPDGVILDGRVERPDIVMIVEPRISGARVDAVCQKFTSFACERIEAQGFAGEVSEQVTGLWLVLGDFNEIASTEEKRGGAPFDPNRAARFHEVLEQLSLLDLGSTGPRFTWRGAARGGYDRTWWCTTSTTDPVEPTSMCLEVSLAAKLEEILVQEELLWFQKSRTEWVESRDRNTRYFHMKAMIKRKRIRIEALQRADETFITEEEALHAHATDHFRRLFSGECGPIQSTIPHCFPQLSPTALQSLIQPVPVEEVHRALFDIGPFKAPRSDGFQAVIFQSNWEFIWPSLFEFIRQIMEGATSISRVNGTLFVLISKIVKSETIHHFRPICLCNVSYKLVTKTIANQLQGYMSELVSLNQRMRGGRKFMTIKVDLEKAYDRLRWDFIDDTLVDVGVPS